MAARINPCQILLIVTPIVMPGLEPGIQTNLLSVWMAGSSPAMTACITIERNWY
jgi:hypothetical protein